MRVCILQPSYIPWKGFFHQIYLADVFVFLDTVQYDRRGWRNRNLIKTRRGLEWLTVPVHAKGTHSGLKIQHVAVVRENDWAQGHLTKIHQAYRSASHFDLEWPWFSAVLREAQKRFHLISDIDQFLTKELCVRLGIKDRDFLVASQLKITDPIEPNQRLIEIIKHLNGATYISGPSARKYIDDKLFDQAGIKIHWMDYDYPTYPQLFLPFQHHTSVIDLIFNVGNHECARYIWASETKSPSAFVSINRN